MGTLPQNIHTENSATRPTPLAVPQPPLAATAQGPTRIQSDKVQPVCTTPVRVPLKARMIFFRQWATCIKAGMSMAGALHHLAGVTRHPELREAARKARICAEGGGRLSAWMRTRPQVFSGVEAALMHVGEASGSLDAMIERIATELENEHSLRQRLLLSTFISKYIVLPLLFLIPNTPNIMMHGMEALEKAGTGISEQEQQSIMLKEGLRGYFQDLFWQMVPVVITLLIVFAVAQLIVRFEPGRRLRDKFMLMIPLTGALWRDLAISRYLTALRLLVRAGVAPAPALEACTGISGNLILDEKFREAARLARQHNLSITNALTRIHLFPQTTLSLLHTGDHTGDMSGMLEYAASYYERDVQNRMKSIPKLVGILCFSLCAVATAIILGRAFLQHYNNIFPAVDKFMGIT